MHLREHAAVALSTAVLGTGLALGTPASAVPAPAADTSAALKAQACTRLWTERGYGYADVCKTWYPQKGYPGKYHGTLWGTVHHYRAPSNRNVVVQASIDGRTFLLGETRGNKSFSNKYRYTKKALMRLCLHRNGASGVSYCGGWW